MAPFFGRIAAAFVFRMVGDRPVGFRESRRASMPGKSEDFITIVSGLPRSGTSMMMRMLEAGGIPVVVDNVRTADEDNPAGYYEFEPVKQTSKDHSWLESAGGKA